MLTFIIHHANFCPNVVHIAKEDFPSSWYDELLKHSKKEGDRNVLYKVIEWNSDKSFGKYVQHECNHIFHQIDLIYEHFAEDERFDIPEWATNATTQHHRMFDSDLIQTTNENVCSKRIRYV